MIDPTLLDALRTFGFPVVMALLMWHLVTVTLKGQRASFTRLANAIQLLYAEMHFTRTGTLPDPLPLDTPPTRRKDAGGQDERSGADRRRT